MTVVEKCEGLPKHVFTLPQLLHFYDFYRSKMLECYRNLEVLPDTLVAEQDYRFDQLPKLQGKSKQVGTPFFFMHVQQLLMPSGFYPTQIHELGPSLTLKLVGECGTDLRGSPSARYSTSWLFLAPGRK
ncbi:MAG: hypothetical protein AB8B85_16975 [Paracoccaceae bacterium]